MCAGLLLFALSGCALNYDLRACNLDDAEGVYSETFAQLSGTCGVIPEHTVELSRHGTAKVDSALASVLSDGMCGANVSYTTEIPGGQVVIAGYVHSEDSNFDTIKGTMTVTYSGSQSCTGSYDVTWARQ